MKIVGLDELTGELLPQASEMTEQVEEQNLRKASAEAEAAEYHSKMSLLKLISHMKT